jgi:NACHT domain
MPSPDRAGAGLSGHLLAIVQNLMATATGAVFLPFVILIWKHFLREKPPDWASSTLASLVAAAILIPAFLLMRRPGSSPSHERSDEDIKAQLAPRGQVIALVRKQWVLGVLDQPLYRTARIALGRDEAPEALGRPSELTVQSGAKPARPVASGMSMGVLLEQVSGFVLLGAAGAGKTMLMAELVRDLIERAKEDINAPLPIAISLERWPGKRVSIDDWVKRELAGAASADIVEGWLQNSQVVLIFDALDEVQFERREQCALAINSFRDSRPSIQVVVSCRSDDYEQLSTKLNVHTAVMIRPLTRQSVDAAIKRGGKRLAGLKTALTRVPQLYEVVSSPLMLDMARIAYESSQDDLPENLSVDDLQRRLLSTYVDRMLDPNRRRGGTSIWRTRQMLKWISRNLDQFGHVYFEAESLVSFAWLPPKLKIRVGKLASLPIGAWTGFRFGAISGTIGFVIGRLSAHWAGVALGSVTAVISVALGSLFTYLAFDNITKWDNGVFGKGSLGDQTQQLINSPSFSPDPEKVRGVMIAKWFMSLLLVRVAGFLVNWATKILRVAMYTTCVLIFPVGALIGLAMGPILSFLLVSIPPEAAWDPQVRAGPNEKTGEWEVYLPHVYWHMCSRALTADLHRPVARLVLWMAGIAPLSHSRALRTATDRAILRRRGTTLCFIHPLLKEYFTASTDSKLASPSLKSRFSVGS